jgi:hypothetical protein
VSVNSDVVLDAGFVERAIQDPAGFVDTEMRLCWAGRSMHLYQLNLINSLFMRFVWNSSCEGLCETLLLKLPRDDVEYR